MRLLLASILLILSIQAKPPSIWVLPPSQLAIVPNTTHVTLMMQTETLAGIISPFIDKK